MRPSRKVCPICEGEEKPLDHQDESRLKRFLTASGKLLPRRISGMCARHQRQLGTAIKRIRYLALMREAANVGGTELGSGGYVEEVRGDWNPSGADPNASVERDDWTEVLLRGATAKQSALQAAGGALSSEEVAELLGVSIAAVKQRQRRGSLLAMPLASGEWGYPARQFAPDGRVRAGLKDVLAVFDASEDPWVILSFLANPDPVSGEGIAFDSLDDPVKTRALVELARTFWEQGAT